MNNGKHFATGSTQPIIPDDGKLRLYSMRFCPFAQRIHHVLAAKGIPHHVIYIHLKYKPEWFPAINPLGKVPAVEINSNEIIYESMIVADYLEEKYPEISLYPKDPLQKAKDKILIERFSGVLTAMYKIYGGGESSVFEELVNALDVFETELRNRNTPYFAGKTPGLVDYMIWPWCERLDVLKILFKYELDAKRFPKFIEWINAMKEDKVVKEHYITPEDHATFIQSIKTTYDCDLLVKDIK
jgi:pyrimidodiazepine synthase/glutathione S-transferase